MPAPSLISYTETTWNTTGDGSGNKTLSISWNSGDFLIGGALSEGADTLTVSGGTGLSWVTQKSNNTANTCGSLISAASPGSSQTTQTITFHNPNGATGANHWGCAIWVWRSSGGLGNSSEQHTATKTVALTPAGGAHSGIMWLVGDFSAGASPAATPTPTDARQAAVDSGRYSFVVADITDQASAGSVNYGLTVTGTTGPYSIVVMEVKGTAAAFQPDEDFAVAGMKCNSDFIASIWGCPR